MSTIVITSYGTLGDYLPYIALGKVLKARGHQVRMVVNKAVYPYVLKAGLEALSNGRPNIGPEEVQRYAHKWNHLPLLRAESPEKKKFINEGFDDDMNVSVDCLLEACDGANMVISCILQDVLVAIIEDVYDICHVRTSVTPFPLCFSKPETENQTDALGSWQNNRDFSRFILAASPYFCQLLPEYSLLYQTGFWFYEDPDWSSWQPSQELREFVEQESKPLVLSYSSIPVVNPQEVVEVHVRAVAKLGRRIVIQQGWAGFNESHLSSDIERDNVMFVDGFISQDWLFYHAAALINHGGVGSIARSLRNGCPLLVEPLGHDQFFNALQVLKLGVGGVMDSQKLTADGIASVLQKKILTPDYKSRAIEVGEKIKAEQGLIKACDLIESWL